MTIAVTVAITLCVVVAAVFLLDDWIDRDPKH